MKARKRALEAHPLPTAARETGGRLRGGGSLRYPRTVTKVDPEP